MTQNTVAARSLPSFTTEDWLGLLRGAVLLAWGYVAAMILARVLALATHTPWPTLGGFDLTYTAVLGEFALVTAILSVLALQRSWFERIPREALARVRTLVAAVLVWLGLHHLAAFHAVGGLIGPLLPLLPVLIVAAFVTLPRRGAWAAAILLVLGHSLVGWLERSQYLMWPAPLAELFAGRGGPGHLVAATVLAAAFAVGIAVRRRLDGAGANRPSRIDPWTGLYEPAFLLERLGAELKRQGRRGGSLSFAVIEIDGFAAHSARVGYGATRQLLRDMGQVLLASCRVAMDTPVRLTPTAFALLLPDATPAGAREVLARIESGLAKLDASLRARSGLTTVEADAAATPEGVIAAATAALGQPRR